MALVSETVQQFVHTYGFERTYWVAFSGGLDSKVLLHALARLRSHYPIKLQAIHVNHNLSPNATSWMDHCAVKAKDLGISLVIRKLDISLPKGESLENAARNARLAIFQSVLTEGDMVLTAHHQDDQAETVLLQLLRGAGPKGMAAMPSIKPLGVGFLSRPLLGLTRQQLHLYALKHQLEWVEDESNKSSQFTRNFLRHEVLPLLTKRWPSVTETLARVASHCADADHMIQQIIEHDLSEVAGSIPQTLSIKKLLSLTSIRQPQVIRHWLQQHQYPLPSSVKMQQILQTVLLAGESKTPLLQWGAVEIRRYQDNLFVMKKLSAANSTQALEWDGLEPLKIEGIGILLAQPLLNTQVSVQFRRGGEKIRLYGQAHHQTLKKLFQANNIPPWQRDRIPLIYLNNKLVAVVGIGVAEELANYSLKLLPEHKYLINAPKAKMGNDTSKKSRNIINRTN